MHNSFFRHKWKDHTREPNCTHAASAQSTKETGHTHTQKRQSFARIPDFFLLSGRFVRCYSTAGDCFFTTCCYYANSTNSFFMVPVEVLVIVAPMQKNGHFQAFLHKKMFWLNKKWRKTVEVRRWGERKKSAILSLWMWKKMKLRMSKKKQQQQHSNANSNTNSKCNSIDRIRQIWNLRDKKSAKYKKQTAIPASALMWQHFSDILSRMIADRLYDTLLIFYGPSERTSLSGIELRRYYVTTAKHIGQWADKEAHVML